MEKIIKKVLIGLVVVLVLIGGGVFLLFSNLDKIVETSIETAGTNTLGSQVEVGSVAMDLIAGTASIYDFSIANPTGFSNAEMVSFDELTVSINLQNTNSENIHINSVVARSPHVLYESTDGNANMDVVSARFANEEGAESADANQIILVIDSILIEDIQGTLLSDKLPNPVEVSLGDVNLNNLEGTPEQLAEQIMGPVTSQVGAAAAQALVQQVTDLLGNADAINEQVQEARDRVQDVGDQAAEALESVGNLFNRD
jgi:hypothetical protein